MKISSYYEFGKKKSIGTGHKFRSRLLGNMLSAKGHTVSYAEDEVIMSDTELLIIDHMYSKKGLIQTTKANNIPVLLIDGSEDDAHIVDVSVSAFINKMAQYKGVEYIVIPKCEWSKYNIYVGNRKKCVFVGIGGYDYNKIVPKIIKILCELELNAIIAPNINEEDYTKMADGVIVMDKDDNYYDAMHECIMAITNGGLTFFQALHYGIPTIAMPQYEHQNVNIDACAHCSVKVSNITDLKNELERLRDSEYLRLSLGSLSQHCVDGMGAQRIVDIIENMVTK